MLRLIRQLRLVTLTVDALSAAEEAASYTEAMQQGETAARGWFTERGYDYDAWQQAHAAQQQEVAAWLDRWHVELYYKFLATGQIPADWLTRPDPWPPGTAGLEAAALAEQARVRATLRTLGPGVPDA